MATSPTTETVVPLDNPPKWANSWMRWALTTPLIQNMIGQGVALLTFTGRRSGRSYTIPVSYHRDGDLVTIITKRPRAWWRNFETPAEVGLRLAGHDYAGTAWIDTDDAGNLRFLTEYLKKRPIDAKAYGLAKDEIVEARIEALLPQLVIIRVAIKADT